MLFMVHCGSEKGSQNQLFQSIPVLLVGREGVGKKITLCTLLIKLSLTIQDDSLVSVYFFFPPACR